MIRNNIKLLSLGIFLELVVLVFSYYESNGVITPFFQSCAKLSGRISLLFFSLLLIYQTLVPDLKDKEIVKTKYYLSLNFSIIHIIHWVLLVIAVYLSGFELVPFRVAGGTIAYVMIILLPFAIKGKILRKTALKTIMNLYLFYVWLIFFMTYVARLTSKNIHFTGSKTSYVLLIAFTSMLMIWRLFLLTKNKLAK